MCKKIIRISIVFCIIVSIELVCSIEAYASPIQEEQANMTEDNEQVTKIIEDSQSVSPDIVSGERRSLWGLIYAAVRIAEKNERPPHAVYSDVLGKSILYEYLDPFPESMNTLEIPSYTLAEDFPQEHVKTFNDFLLFCTSVVARSRKAHTGVIHEHPLVKMRLELNNPIRYEDFLATVLLSLSLHFPGRGNINHFDLCYYYIRMFMSPSRNSFFVENIIEPLSNDLANGKYRGYRFKSSNLPQFIREFADNCSDRKMEVAIRGEMRGIYGIRYSPLTLRLPEEFYLLNYYAQTFLLVYKGELGDAYKTLYRYKMPRSPYSSMPPLFSYNPFGSGVSRSYEYRLLPPRPYYYYSDDDRYQWFKYLQAELRSAGHSDFADSILETEIEHYRELLVWQLQLRAYLIEKLYKYGDSNNISTLTELLTSEYTALKNDPLFQSNFKKAIEALRDMDDKVRATTPIDVTKGIIILPWIDREAIDSKQGIKSEVLSLQQNQITWSADREEIDDETKEEMKNSYEKATYYIRVLAVISEILNQKNNLETMVQLHSKLASNTNVNCTPTGVYYQDFNSAINNNIDSEYIHETELSPQAKLDQRRYSFIVNDFWGWQARRKNGDMSVGEIILPWVEVQDK